MKQNLKDNGRGHNTLTGWKKYVAILGVRSAEHFVRKRQLKVDVSRQVATTTTIWSLTS